MRAHRLPAIKPGNKSSSISLLVADAASDRKMRGALRWVVTFGRCNSTRGSAGASRSEFWQFAAVVLALTLVALILDAATVRGLKRARVGS